MKTACGVIRDLLPLYAENMTGEESNALIREHLASCEACSAALGKLQLPLAPEAPAAPAEDGSLRLVRRSLRRRRQTAVLFAALLVFTVMLVAVSRVVKPEYITRQDSGVTVTEGAAGEQYVRFADRVTSCRLLRTVNEEGQTVAEIRAWTSLWDRLLGKTTPSLLLSSPTAPVDLAYYCDLSAEDSSMTVIYGTDTAKDLTVLPRLVLGYYFAAALLAAAILGLVCLLVCKNRKASRICRCLLAAPVAYLLAHLLMTTRFASFSTATDFLLNAVAALAVYGILLSGAVLLRQHRQDARPAP